MGISDVLDLLIKGAKMGVELSRDVEKLTAQGQAKVPAYNLDQLTDDLAIILRAKDEKKTLEEAVRILQTRKVPDAIILKIIGRIYGGK